ncbi:Ca(2+)/calmodulin-responsive adenylate cyclase-like [Ctenocephalides felis]|uniref:Ca(2+)/calmodulin-responsive adenylate cyclase-like n=2 Tax=Ctenocephalides felis TaxID=7515 RepID=UPI000E6E1AD5|nr:Ca(2+)/calmodulin-responsive adenylate cyclase-like [Ctenocephalides felis]
MYRHECDPEFAASLWCCLILVVCGAGIQGLMLPRTLFLLLLFLTAFAWVTSLLMLLLAARLQWIFWDVTKSFTLRLALTIFTVLLVFSVSILNVFTCLPNPSCEISQAHSVNDHLSCPVPIYVPLGGILSGSLVPAHTSSLVQLLMFLVASGLHGRCLERVMRLCYLRKNEANRARHEANVLQQSGVRLLHDLLPQHVTQFYLEKQRRPGSTDLYCESYAYVGVLFATVTDYHEFCTDMESSTNGLDCLRQLNEIICDFDKLLQEDCFGAIDKIKCFGSTYMAAVGLSPEHKINHGDNNSIRKFITILLDFTQAMHARLLTFNTSTYRNFMLRAGVNIGPVIAGVIGANKPQYDIWGETVNIAYHMDSTGLAGLTQVTENVAHVIRDTHYNFKCRGMVKIKGKGDTMTYLVVERQDHQFSTGATYGRVTPGRIINHQMMNQPLHRYEQCVPAKYVQHSMLNRGNSNMGESSRLLPYSGNNGPHIVKVLPMQKNCQHVYHPEPSTHTIFDQTNQQVQSSLNHSQMEPFLKPLPKPPLPDHVSSYHIRRSEEPSSMLDTRGSSVDELSSHMQSATSTSSSSSDESYSNTAPDSPVKKWLYPGDIQPDTGWSTESEKLEPPNWMPSLLPLPSGALMQIAAGGDSTTTAGSVAPPCEVEAGYSCKSFEYLANNDLISKINDNGSGKRKQNQVSESSTTTQVGNPQGGSGQFEREIRRLFERRQWPLAGEGVSHSVGLAAIQELARSQEPRGSESVCGSVEDNTEGDQEEQVSTRDCSHSEWSDDEENEDGNTNNEQECPDRESNGYTTDEQGLENVSLLNEAGLTDAEGALSDVNSIYHHPDHENGSISSRSSSRAISLDSLSGMYCDSEGVDGWPGLALLDIRSVSESITKKFGCSDSINVDTDL